MLVAGCRYWWPNKPFRENYTPQLHVLSLTVDSAETPAADSSVGDSVVKHRFGFVEWSEAAPDEGTWFLVNGRRINFVSDATPEAAMSSYDCYTNSPAFATLEGAKETWKRYMRVGMSANRIHQSTPTQVGAPWHLFHKQNPVIMLHTCMLIIVFGEAKQWVWLSVACELRRSCSTLRTRSALRCSLRRRFVGIARWIE